MAETQRHTDDRIVKVPFPVALIRRMDEALVSGRGGFQTRAELMREAVDNLLNELDYPEAPDEPARHVIEQQAESLAEDALVAAPVHNGRGAGLEDLLAGLPGWERDELTLADLAGTALRSPELPVLVTEGVVSTPEEPLLGLHNRDYVSVWALQRLARYTAAGPILFEDYLKHVTRAAWYYGSQLDALERRGDGKKLTVLLPTNASKRPSAERGFQSFAVGHVSKRQNGRELHATGPLFAWQAVQLTDVGQPMVGLTENGWQLLHDLEGLSLDLPHSPEIATKYLNHLQQHAPGDQWGFEHLLRTVADARTRDELVDSFASTHPEWTAATASSIAQGYISRCREWGLVEAKLVDGRYWLTAAGREQLKALT